MMSYCKRLVVKILVLALIPCLGTAINGAEAQSLCRTRGFNPKIINGTTCSESGSPFVRVMLRARDGGRALCSGVLLSRKAVLTAAHCFLVSETLSATVRVGKSNVRARRVILHPDVSIDFRIPAVINDAAIVLLSKPIAGTPLPILASQTINVGDVFEIYGYGIDEQGRVNKLRSGMMTIDQVAAGNFQATYTGVNSDTCNGDSGGPAILTTLTRSGQPAPAIIGITSSGTDPRCAKGDVSLFTNLQSPEVLQFVMEVLPRVGLL